MLRAQAILIQRWWRSLVASEHTLSGLCEKYRMMHIHEYMDDLSLTQRESIHDDMFIALALQGMPDRANA